MCTAEGFGPAELAWVALHFEVCVAFGAAEAELFGVVADKCDALAWVAGAGAEMAGFDAHFGESYTEWTAVVVGFVIFLSSGRKCSGGPCSDFRGGHLQLRETSFELHLIHVCTSASKDTYYISLGLFRAFVFHGNSARDRRRRGSSSLLRTPPYTFTSSINDLICFQGRAGLVALRRYRGGVNAIGRAYYKGGFEKTMNRREAALILETPYVHVYHS